MTEQDRTAIITMRENGASFSANAVLSEDGAHIDLYAMAALNWRATQELLERIERLEEKQ